MASEIRTVIDTGVAVSAVLLPRSVPRQAFDHAVGLGRILVSEQTIDELQEVLRRPKFNKYIPEDDRREFLAALVYQGDLISVTESVTECRDPKDNKFLELAISGKATHIISGDPDLLALHPFRGIAVLNPQEFLTWKRFRRFSAEYVEQLFAEPSYSGLHELANCVDGWEHYDPKLPDYGLPEPIFVFVEALLWFAQSIRSSALNYFEATPASRQAAMRDALTRLAPPVMAEYYAQGMRDWQDEAVDRWIVEYEDTANAWMWSLLRNHRQEVDRLMW